jgi:hypothetical protein
MKSIKGQKKMHWDAFNNAFNTKQIHRENSNIVIQETSH